MKYLILLSLCFVQGYGENLDSLVEESSTAEQELLSLEDELFQIEKFSSFPEEQTTVITPQVSPAPVLTQDHIAESQTEPMLLEETFLAEDEPFVEDSPGIEQAIAAAETFIAPSKRTIQVQFSQVLQSSPLIYLLLLFLSSVALTIFLYAFMQTNRQARLTNMTSSKLREKFLSNHFSSATEVCQNSQGILSRMILGALSCRKHGLQAMLENMKAEGKRASLPIWQQLGILHDIAIIAPMLGLLGTVMGLFYAFYDLNRSVDSVQHLLDGLGISVGTTVAGILVAILAMILHSLIKFRLLRALAYVETEATSLTHLMHDHQ